MPKNLAELLAIARLANSMPSAPKTDSGDPATHQQLVTDANGVTVWDDRTHYESEISLHSEVVYDGKTMPVITLTGIGYREGNKAHCHEGSYFEFIFGTKVARVDGDTLTSGMYCGDVLVSSFKTDRRTGFYTIEVKGQTTYHQAGDVMSVRYAYPTLKQLDDKFVPTTVPVIQTATIGQTIAVKAVDANGKPTEWEAVDAASGGSGGSACQEATESELIDLMLDVGMMPVLQDIDGAILVDSDEAIIFI